MSEFVYKKVVRLKLSDSIGNHLDKYDYIDELESKCKDLFGWGQPGKFVVGGTDKDTYLDYVIDYVYGSDRGEYGRCRKLSLNESEKYRILFKDMFSKAGVEYAGDISNNLRLVEVSYYNGCDETDYYEAEDDFLKEV